MIVTLTPYAGEAELADPAMSGPWAAELAKVAEHALPPPWGSYMAWRDGRAVGSGAFKGPPGDDGAVEIAYLTFLPFEGSGVAKAVAAELVTIARRNGVARIVAHTLPEANSSTRVLAATGFTKVSDVTDPADGLVWRWELPQIGSAG